MMPKKLVEDTYNGYMTKMKESMGIRTERVDTAPPQAAEQAAVAAPTTPAAPAAPATGGEANVSA
jgi:hypothetical protein